MRKRWVAVLAVGALALAACSDDGTDTRSGSASGSGSGTGSETADTAKCDAVGKADAASTTIAVTLEEFSIKPEADTAPAGVIHFALTNAGGEPHEFIVVRGVTPGDLPLTGDGALDEDKLPKDALIGEVEPFPGGGETCDGTFDLTAGDYTLLCNIVDTPADGKVVAHLDEGMVTTFTVT